MRRISDFKLLFWIGGLGLILLLGYQFYPKEEFEYHKTELDLIEVYIDGGINNEGTYLVPSDLTLRELINLAGGLSVNADFSLINFSELIEARSYHIPTFKGKEEDPKAGQKYDLNQVTYEQLISIPNITANRANGIINYRKDHLGFNHLDELLNVSGIGVVTYEKIKDYFFI